MRRALAIVLFLLAGMLGVGGAAVVVRAVNPGIATYIGAFVGPALLIWCGAILLGPRKE